MSSDLSEHLKKSKYFALLPPPEGAIIEERINDYMWFDHRRIMYSVPKENQKQLSAEENLKEIEKWKDQYGDEKFLMVAVINPHAKSTKENRDWAAKVLPDLITGIVLISDSALGRMAVNLFIGLRPPSYPLKVFKDAQSAEVWITQFLKDE